MVGKYKKVTNLEGKKVGKKTTPLSAHSRRLWNGGRGRMMIELVILLTRSKTHYWEKKKKKVLN